MNLALGHIKPDAVQIGGMFTNKECLITIINGTFTWSLGFHLDEYTVWSDIMSVCKYVIKAQ